MEIQLVYVGFFDELWTYNQHVPDEITLFIFVIYRVILIIFLLGLYYFCKFRITESIQAPSLGSSLNPPPNLLFSLKLIYLSCILLELSTIITHLSALIDRGDRYLLVGEEDLIFLSAMLLNLYGIYIFGFVLLNKEHTQNYQLSNIGMYIIILLTIGTYLSSILSQIEGESGNIVTLLLGLLVIFTLIYLNLKTTLVSTNNPVLTIRKRLLIFITIAWIIFPTLLYLFFIPDGLLTPLITFKFNLNHAPTRTFVVEYLFLSVDFFSLTIGFVIWSIVYLPFWIRKLGGLDDFEYYENFDYRFDFDWTRKRHIISTLDKLPEYQKKSDEKNKYILSYASPKDKMTLKELSSIFSGKILHFSSIDEETMKSLFLPTHDFVFIDSTYSAMTKGLLEYIRDTYYVEISLKDSITISKRFKFQSDEFRYALLGIFPPYWNIRRKFWLLYAKSLIHSVLRNFLKDFYSYFEELSVNKAVFAILKFPVVKNEIQSIPSISKGLNIPDPKYVQII